MDISSLCAIGIATTASVTDVRTRRIPNALTFGAAGAALLFHTVAPTGHGFTFAVSGWFVGAAMMFLPFALRGLGAGDVKLVAALGAWLGPLNAVWLAVYAMMAGALSLWFAPTACSHSLSLRGIVVLYVLALICYFVVCRRRR